MPGMTLQMQSVTGAPQDLAAHLDYIETGAMGDCVSVIVGWNPDANGRMANMRGFHGAGGLPNVNFTALFNGVPNNANVQVWMVSGSSNNHLKGSFGIEGNRARILHEVRNVAGLNNVIMIRSVHGVGNAQIDRSGQVTKM